MEYQDEYAERQKRRKRIENMKLVIVLVLVGMILLSLGLNIFLLIRVQHLSGMLQQLTNIGMIGLL